MLFIGNSLTYVNDLPAIVAALANSFGQQRLEYKTICRPNVSLEDHWKTGDAIREIRKRHWDVVVLQQGPSALPESRTVLLEYTRKFAEEIRQSGATPALYMVWPSSSRQQDFDRVIESYQIAAREVNGILLPAGEAWRAALRIDQHLSLYGDDGFHPHVLGSLLAACVIYYCLYECDNCHLSQKLQVSSISVSLTAQQAELLETAARQAIQKFTGCCVKVT